MKKIIKTTLIALTIVLSLASSTSYAKTNIEETENKDLSAIELTNRYRIQYYYLDGLNFVYVYDNTNCYTERDLNLTLFVLDETYVLNRQGVPPNKVVYQKVTNLGYCFALNN